MNAEALFAKAKSGDRDALADLLQRAGEDVRASVQISAAWQGVIDIEDVLQVTYIEAVLAFDRHEPVPLGNLVPWLVRIAQNNVRDAIREMEAAKRPNVHQRIGPSGNGDSCIELLEWLGCTTTTPSRDAAAREAQQILQEALQQLPPNYREAIRLFDLDGRSASEAAQIVGVSVANLHMLRSRGRERLHRRLGTGSRFFSGSAWTPAAATP